ncbi:cupin domain-containing protein [Micromonospora sp. NBC_01813]|uniref:cupin domain-containing protein n=1 Tax=Micromonospora sp. NBC_01813 TaxID=2975988 RepID=UPI002DD8F5C4|nr:cupin domain-containing protein [Micromonospora sp. NBC_01813]WSA09170.1 cupin domain-containing protein [Micromonospora sp. NBC_01813]
MLNPQLYRTSVNWDDIPATDVRPGVRRKVYATDEVVLAWHELSVGMDLNPHTHDDFDQLVMILGGRCNYYVDGVPHDMGPGSMLLVPRGAEHYVEPTEGPCINLDLFAPPRADFLAHAWRPAAQD